MGIYFSDSRPDRQKRARRETRIELERSPVPAAKTYELMPVERLFDGTPHVFVFDVESYPNYFLVSFKSLVTGQVICFEDSADASINTDLLGYILHRFLCIGFNSKPYDLPITAVACLGVRRDKLKEISDQIINEGLRPFQIAQKYGINTSHVNHIDLIDVAPITASLKIYGGRLHCERMQDLPYSNTTMLTREQAQNVKDYNVNDLDMTELLYNHLKGHINLRIELSDKYGIDLRSKSDAQISEAVICSELEKLGLKTEKGRELPAGTQTFYTAPGFIGYRTPMLQRALNIIQATPFTLDNGGRFACPQEVTDLKIRLGSSVYRLGVGGLHSSEQSVSYYSNEQFILKDIDVASYYPSIILTLGLFPPHLGPAFLEVYRAIYDRRLAAKSRHKVTGDEAAKIAAEALKIVINGGFGKLSNRYSKLYAPHLGLAVTMCGQLSLLMLIEMIELAGIHVVSGNTDGIVIMCPRDREKELETIVMQWEERTGFQTEETRYRSIHSRDVNNYFAVKEDGKVKVKGVFAEVGSALNSPLSKNPESLILTDAVQAFLSKGTPIHETVFASGDIRRFVNVRQVKGGGQKGGVYLGKAIRWYYSTCDDGPIEYVDSGNVVPKSHGAKPLMTLPQGIPDDLDRLHYVNEANDILFDIGFHERPNITRSLIDNE